MYECLTYYQITKQSNSFNVNTFGLFWYQLFSYLHYLKTKTNSFILVLVNNLSLHKTSLQLDATL